MKDLFSKHHTTDTHQTQNWFVANMGLMSESDWRFTVDLDGDEQGAIVYIFDDAQSGLDKLAYTFHFTTLEAGEAFKALMEQEVANWDVEDYYTATDIRQEAIEDYQAANSGFMGGLV